MHQVQWEILLGVAGLIFSIIYMHWNTTSRFDAMTNRIDDLHREIIALIKKMK